MGFGVPVIWAGLLAAMRRTEVRLPEFKRALVGGSALPPSMAEAFQRDYGIALTHAGNDRNIAHRHHQHTVEQT